MNNCRDCFNLILINEQGDFERRCSKKLETKYEDHDCEKYVRLVTDCYCCD